MSNALNIVFVRPWWTWSPGNHQWFDWGYHWFNIVEGCAWCVFAGLILRRHVAHWKSRLELIYAFAFLAFAATDFREVWEQSSWLIWLKLINLLALLWIRRSIMSRYYPDARLY